MLNKSKQFFIAHQSRDFLHEIVELMFRLAVPPANTVGIATASHTQFGQFIHKFRHANCAAGVLQSLIDRGFTGLAIHGQQTLQKSRIPCDSGRAA
jgi:hypothetical protein